MGTLTLYGMSYSIYVRIVQIVLAEKGLFKNADYQQVEFDVFDKREYPMDFLEMSPFGKVPVLQDGETSIYETGAICRYIDKRYCRPPLQPSDIIQFAKMNQVISIVDNYAYPSMIWGTFVERISATEEGRKSRINVIAESQPLANRSLMALEKTMERNQYFSGSEFGLADCYVAPVLMYFLKTPEGRKSIAQFPLVSSWWEKNRKRRSVVKTADKYG